MNYQKALITGASSGIGAACARALAQAGMDLILIARRRERLEALYEELLQGRHAEVRIETLDVTDGDAIERFGRQVDLSGVDVLLNNAGLALGVNRVYETERSLSETMIRTNIEGLLGVTRLVVPHMVQRRRGHIVNIGSVAGRWVYPGGGVYCATKFAVRALSEGLRMDLLGTSVRVTNIEPGMVETEFSQVRLGDEAKAKSVYKGMKPLSDTDIAESVMWCLMRPSHVNVQEMVIFPTDQAGVSLVHRES